MKTTNQLLSLLAILIISSPVIAQGSPENKEEISQGGPTIESQFNYVFEKSSRYEAYKVIKITWLNKLRSNVSDSMEVLRKELIATQQSVATQKDEMNALKTVLKNTEDELASVNAEKESIHFLGIPLKKATYKNIMWGISGGLFVLLLFYIFRFKRSHIITSQIKKTLSEIQEGFDAYKKRAMEKEQKLARELQNELNKRRGFY